MRAAVLKELACTAPKSYFDQTSSGDNVLNGLFQLLVSSNLLAPGVSSDVNRLHGVFDVAVAHGMGRLIIDFVRQVCYSSYGAPAEFGDPFLSDPDCVRQWVQQSLSRVHQQLNFMLSQGLSSLAASCALGPIVSKLGCLDLVAHALAAAPHSVRAHAIRRPLSSNIDGCDLVENCRRLIQCAQILQWLGHQRLRQTTPSGRFVSHEAWASTVEKRRSGAGSSSHLFLDDILEEVMKHDNMNPPAYPPPSLESLIATLFLQDYDRMSSASHASSGSTLTPRLALLIYCLVDANFLTGPEVAESLRRELFILPSTTLGYMLLLLLDDSQLVPSGSSSPNLSLTQAINCAPGVDGAKLPFRALQVFLEKGAPDVALSLLRQRCPPAAVGSAAETIFSAKEACVALRIRLTNGCLVEAFIEMKRHLRSVTPEAQRMQHAQQLISELLSWGAHAAALHAIIRLPVSPGPEESALVSYLEDNSAIQPQSGLILSIYFLLRGRIPEALVAFARHGSQGGGGGSPELEASKAQLEELLAAAARMMPDAQKALVVSTGPQPALRSWGAEGGTSLVTAVSGVAAGNLPHAIISVAPSVAQCPLVGGIACMAAEAQKAGQLGGVTVSDAEAAGVVQPPPDVEISLLFGEPVAVKPVAVKPVAVKQVGFGQFSSSAVAAGGRQGGGHELDKLLGLAQRAPARGPTRGLM